MFDIAARLLFLHANLRGTRRTGIATETSDMMLYIRIGVAADMKYHSDFARAVPSGKLDLRIVRGFCTWLDPRLSLLYTPFGLSTNPTAPP